MEKKNVVLDKIFDFALSIIKLYTFLTKNQEYVLSKQLLRSGTSIRANVEEANAGISKKDFTAKMSTASKEARESRYWLRLLQKSQLVPYDYSKYLSEVEELVKLTTSIVKSAQLGKDQPGTDVEE